MISIEPPSSPSISAAAGSGPLRLLHYAGHSSVVCFLLLASCDSSQAAAPATTVAPASPKWQLAWSAEFNGANGSAPDPTKCVYTNSPAFSFSNLTGPASLVNETNP